VKYFKTLLQSFPLPSLSHKGREKKEGNLPTWGGKTEGSLSHQKREDRRRSLPRGGCVVIGKNVIPLYGRS
jgi:hypothetical protein